MNYKSTRSEKFIKWLEGATAEWVTKSKRLVELEKSARLVVHQYDLTGDIDPKDMGLLSRAVKQLQSDYEQK